MTASICLKLGDFGGPGLVVYNYKRLKEEIKYRMTQMTIVEDKLRIMMLTRRFYSLFGAEQQLNILNYPTYSFVHGRFVRLLQVPNPWALTLKCR